MKRSIASISLFFIVLFFASSVFTVHGEQGANIVLHQTGIQVSGGAGATYLLLRIVAPDGRVVCDMSSDGGSLNWSTSGNLPDGRYSYEVRQGYTPKRKRAEDTAGGSGEEAAPVWNGSGGFLLKGGLIVPQVEGETGAIERISSGVTTLLTEVGHFLVTPVYADVLHYDDVIITGSECVGFDCIDGEAFGYDTMKLKENNLQIFFDDTSLDPFPSNDWRIRTNDTTSGGLSYFTIEDSTAGRRPFTIEAGAPANSLYVEDYGRIGLGTSVPYVELHIVDGDTPTVRLDQDGSSGWTAQSWDIAGNETNFFVRDVTNGSKLSFRIQPNTPSNTLCLKNSGNVGIGTWSPTHTLDVVGNALITGNLELGSSRSLKSNIRSLDAADASKTLAALQPVRFYYKTSPDEESLGFIAEDVPDLVATKDRKTISTMDVVAVLTKVVQDQQATIARLEQSVAKLEKQVANR
ncbi:MAG: tail fiber domain-containing protein [Proteobacteria bacterium]|nr:tail fiber domain-containing protein [Pseudomonadota bacterium]MBU1649052.1 tail fiber domain-containing protein [Pseudomonadota bacterium]MBU1986788.1 tail fiber domain-containing protein [Pseudomonadota bacterium]